MANYRTRLIQELADRDYDGDIVKAAIDWGGGQDTSVSGVLEALDDAGYKIVSSDIERKLLNALAVMVLDRNIRQHLEATDPKALEQAERALREARPDFVTTPEPLEQ